MLRYLPSTRWLVLVLFLVFLTGEGSHSLIISRSYPDMDIYTFVDRFGFSGQSGQLTMTVHELSGDPAFALCSHDQWQELVSTSASVRDIFCEMKTLAHGPDYVPFSQNFPCELPLIDLSHNISLLQGYHVKETQIYSMIVVHCSVLSPASLSFTLQLENGASQLPLGEEQLRFVYGLSAMGWAALLSWWVAIIFHYRRVAADPFDPASPIVLNNGIRVHLCFALVLIFKMSVALASAEYWTTYETTGVSSSLLLICSTFLYSSSECFLFAALFLIAKGWRITTDRLGHNEARAFICTVCFLIACLFFFSVYDSGYNFLPLLILYFFLVPKVFQSLSINSGMLRSYIIFFQNRRALQPPQTQAAITRLLAAFDTKLKMYTNLRFHITWYLGIVALANFLSVIVSFNYEWFITAFQEASTLFLVFQFCYTVRPSLAEQGLFSLSQDLFTDTGLAFPALFGTDGSLPLWDNTVEIPAANEEELNNELTSGAFLVVFPCKENPAEVADMPIALATSPHCRQMIHDSI